MERGRPHPTPPAPPPPGLTCAPRGNRNWEPSRDRRGPGRGARSAPPGVAVQAPSFFGPASAGWDPRVGPTPLTCPACSLATTSALQYPGLPLCNTWLQWLASSNFLYLNS